ncbi:MAG: hypothetical protein N2691_02550 [Patescibacteria group bacterium]|nr:hypothetical protein [Patescibacteria group bacterium]
MSHLQERSGRGLPLPGLQTWRNNGFIPQEPIQDTEILEIYTRRRDLVREIVEIVYKIFPEQADGVYELLKLGERLIRLAAAQNRRIENPFDKLTRFMVSDIGRSAEDLLLRGSPEMLVEHVALRMKTRLDTVPPIFRDGYPEGRNYRSKEHLYALYGVTFGTDGKPQVGIEVPFSNAPVGFGLTIDSPWPGLESVQEYLMAFPDHRHLGLDFETRYEIGPRRKVEPSCTPLIQAVADGYLLKGSPNTGGQSVGLYFRRPEFVAAAAVARLLIPSTVNALHANGLSLATRIPRLPASQRNALLQQTG